MMKNSVGLLLAGLAMLMMAPAKADGNRLLDTTWEVYQCLAAVNGQATEGLDQTENERTCDPKTYPAKGNLIQVQPLLGNTTTVVFVLSGKVFVFGGYISESGTREVEADNETYKVGFLQIDFLDDGGPGDAVGKSLNIYSLLDGTSDGTSARCASILTSLSAGMLDPDEDIGEGRTVCKPGNDDSVIFWSLCTRGDAPGQCNFDGPTIMGPPNDGMGTGGGGGG
jgi:hypothetical protein